MLQCQTRTDVVLPFIYLNSRFSQSEISWLSSAAAPNSGVPPNPLDMLASHEELTTKTPVNEGHWTLLNVVAKADVGCSFPINVHSVESAASGQKQSRITHCAERAVDQSNSGRLLPTTYHVRPRRRRQYRRSPMLSETLLNLLLDHSQTTMPRRVDEMSFEDSFPSS